VSASDVSATNSKEDNKSQVTATKVDTKTSNKVVTSTTTKKKVVANNVAKKKVKIKTVTMTSAKKFVKKAKPSSSNSRKSYMQAYDYRNNKMTWFNVNNNANIDQYPGGLRFITNTSTKKNTYKIVSSTKTKTSYNKNTGVTTVTSYKVLYNIKKSKSKVVLVTTSSSKQTPTNLANPYLAPSTDAQVNNPQIIALANSITKNCKSDDYYNKAALIYNWVQVNVDYDTSGNTSAIGVLSQKSPDGNYKAYCVGFSNLMASLCRAVGVPVRYNSIFYFDVDQYPFQGHGSHVYTEVYVRGSWLYADAATVGFIAPLNYKGSMQAITPEASYYTADNQWNYWYYECNHNLQNHVDSNIVRESQPVSIFRYLQLPIKPNNPNDAYNILAPLAVKNGYHIYNNIYFYGTLSNYVHPGVTSTIWGFHYFNTLNEFLGYMIIDNHGIIFAALQSSYYIPPGTEQDFIDT